MDLQEQKSRENLLGFQGGIGTEVFIQPLTAHVFQFRIINSSIGEISKIRGLDFPNVFVNS